MKKKEKTLADLIEDLCQAINYLNYCREADKNDWEAEENIEEIKKSINELLK
jgi:superfamily I DNA/RNA helicase